MIYAIHNTTKEHSLVTWKRSDWDYDWRIVEADPDGWIPWHGGECPLPDVTPYETKHVSGATFQGDRPETFSTHWRGDDWDAVIAYRPILDTKAEPAWDGEGLPPVGSMAEISRDSLQGDGFQEGDIVEVLAHKRAKASDVAIVWSDRVRKSVQLIPEMFRPIRSEEDRAVEEMMDVSERSAPAEKLCRALYRAGYRKTGGE